MLIATNELHGITLKESQWQDVNFILYRLTNLIIFTILLLQVLLVSNKNIDGIKGSNIIQGSNGYVNRLNNVQLFHRHTDQNLGNLICYIKLNEIRKEKYYT